MDHLNLIRYIINSLYEDAQKEFKASDRMMDLALNTDLKNMSVKLLIQSTEKLKKNVRNTNYIFDDCIENISKYGDINSIQVQLEENKVKQFKKFRKDKIIELQEKQKQINQKYEKTKKMLLNRLKVAYQYGYEKLIMLYKS